jgi:type II secretory pathway component PulL
LTLSGTVLKELNADNIQSISFENNALTLNLNINDFNQLSTLIQKLHDQGLTVTQNSAETQNDHVASQLTVTLEE